MRAGRLLLLIAAGSAFIVVAAAIWLMVRPDLLVNPLNRRIMFQSTAWGAPVPLTPDPLQDRTDRSAVEVSISNAGFERATETTAWRYRSELKLGKDVYVREADRFPCQIKLYVVVAFDSADTLTEATGFEHEHGCL
jgi:hypothetical protein